MDGTRKLAALGLMTALTACAGSGDRYPSLALRPFEKGEAVAAPAPPPITNPLTGPALSAAALADLQRRAAASHSAFLRQQPLAARLVRAAAGQGVESDARARALVALAELSSQRSETSAVLADLDRHVANAATVLRPDPALGMAQTEVAALLSEEDAALARLWESMGS